MSGKIIVVLQMIQSLIAKRNRFVAHRVKKKIYDKIDVFLRARVVYCALVKAA